MNVSVPGGLPMGLLALVLPVVAVFAFFRGDIGMGLLAVGVALAAGGLWAVRRKRNASHPTVPPRE